jgi:hypothetical protein
MQSLLASTIITPTRKPVVVCTKRAHHRGRVFVCQFWE